MTVTIRVEAGWRHVPRDGLHPSSSSIEPCTPRTALPMKPVMATVAASRSPDDLRQVHRQGMWRALEGLPRYIATPTVAKHRLFVWLDARICPDHQLIVIARDDDTTFGILHSRFHEVWSLRLGTSLENRPRYTPTTTFEIFPFPDGLSPDIPAAAYPNGWSGCKNRCRAIPSGLFAVTRRQRNSSGSAP